MRIRTRDQAKGVLIKEGTYNMVLVGMNPYKGHYGNRVALVFRFDDGEYCGGKILKSVSTEASRGDELKEVVDGIGLTEKECRKSTVLDALKGKRCRVVVKTVESWDGKSFSRIIEVQPPLPMN